MRFALAAVVVLASVTGGEAAAPGEVSSAEHRFVARFGAAPNASTIPLPGGGSVSRWRLDDGAAGVSMFIDVSGTDLPLAAVVEKMSTSWKAKGGSVASDAPASVDGVEGRDLLFTGPDLVLRGRYLVRDGWAFQVYGGGGAKPGETLEQTRKRLAPVEALIASFHFTGPSLPPPPKAGTVSSKEHGVAVEFPSAPTVSAEKRGKETVEQWTLSGNVGGASIALFLEVGGVPDRAADPARELARLIDHVKHAGQKVVSDQAISVDGVPGRDVLLSGKDAFLHGRYFIRSGKVYQAYGVVGLDPGTPAERAQPALKAVEGFLATIRFRP